MASRESHHTIISADPIYVLATTRASQHLSGGEDVCQICHRTTMAHDPLYVGVLSTGGVGSGGTSADGDARVARCFSFDAIFVVKTAIACCSASHVSVPSMISTSSGSFIAAATPRHCFTPT